MSTTAQHDSRYTTVTVSAYGRNEDGHDAFDEFNIKPTRTTTETALGRVLDSEAFYHYANNTHFYQFPQGAGLVEYNAKRESETQAIRARDGTMLSGLKADTLLNALDEFDRSVHRIVTQHLDTNDASSRYDNGTVVEFDDGAYLLAIRDCQRVYRPYGEYSYTGCLIEPDDPAYSQLTTIIDDGRYEDLIDVVAPDDVAFSNEPVMRTKQLRHGDDGGDVVCYNGPRFFIPTPDIVVDSDDITYAQANDGNGWFKHLTPEYLYITDSDTDDGIDPGSYVKGDIRYDGYQYHSHTFDDWHRVERMQRPTVQF